LFDPHRFCQTNHLFILLERAEMKYVSQWQTTLSKDIDRHGPRLMPNNCKNFNPPNFSLLSTFNGSCPPQNHYVQRHINNRYINSYIMCRHEVCLSDSCCNHGSTKLRRKNLGKVCKFVLFMKIVTSYFSKKKIFVEKWIIDVAPYENSNLSVPISDKK